MIDKNVVLSNSVRLHVRDNEKAKPVVLFLHFSGGTSRIFDGVLPLFEKDYRIIVPDLRGHGRSDKPESGYHLDDFAGDIYLLLKELKVERCHIAGSSMGAEVGLRFAASHPESVLSLVCEGALYNEFGEYGLVDGSAEEMETEKARFRERLAGLNKAVYPTMEAYFEGEKARFTACGIWNEWTVAYIEDNMERLDNGGYATRYPHHVRLEYIGKYMDVRFEQDYPNVKCPVLFLPSEEEWNNERIRLSMHAFAEMLNSPHQIKRIEGSVHAYIWMQFPRVAGETVKDFIESLGGEERFPANL